MARLVVGVDCLLLLSGGGGGGRWSRSQSPSAPYLEICYTPPYMGLFAGVLLKLDRVGGSFFALGVEYFRARRLWRRKGRATMLAFLAVDYAFAPATHALLARRPVVQSGHRQDAPHAEQGRDRQPRRPYPAGKHSAPKQP